MSMPEVPPLTTSVSAHSQDRTIRLYQIVTAFVAFLVLLVGLLTLLQSFTASDNSARVAAGNDLAACRSEAQLPITTARGKLDGARSELEVLLVQGLAASADNDPLTKPAIDAVPDALEDVQAAQAELDAATQSYADALVKARMDPEAFLDDCHTDPS